MATINAEVTQFPSKVPVDSTMSIAVKIDNMENVAPLTGGNCKPGDTQGELVNASLNVSGPKGGTVANSSDTVCALYGYGRPDETVVFQLTPKQKGTFIANVEVDAKRNTGPSSQNSLGPFRFEVVPRGEAPQPPENPEDPSGGNGGGAGGDLLQTVVQNPLGSGIVFIGGITALNTVVGELANPGGE